MPSKLFLVTENGEAETAMTIPDAPCRIRVPDGTVVERLDEASGHWIPLATNHGSVHHPLNDWSVLDN